eukprot:g77485.t1
MNVASLSAMMISLSKCGCLRVSAGCKKPGYPFSTSARSNRTVYITTPIFYVNAKPHLGHLYSVVMADALARWHRDVLGAKTRLLVGTDEHGSKIQNAAERGGMGAQQFCDSVSEKFRNIFEKADIHVDDYIRTTQARHIETVQHVWSCLYAKGLIYKDVHKGWYCEADEAFIAESEIEITDPDGKRAKKKETGQDVEWLCEENYMFRLSSFREPLREWLSEVQPIEPNNRKNEVLGSLDGLRDLSVSRPASRVSWGIPVPDDHSQTIYVWLDALVCYLTSMQFPKSHSEMGWPPHAQFIGKDILKFHAIVWPAILLGLQLELPRRIYVHGHWVSDGIKMSKSLGNTVDPSALLDPRCDYMRFFLMQHAALVSDNNFTKENYERSNRELADKLGNLLERAITPRLLPDGLLPPLVLPLTKKDQEMVAQINQLPGLVSEHFENGNFSQVLNTIWDLVSAVNIYFSSHEPWRLRKEGDLDRVNTIHHITLEALRVVGILLQPILPSATSRLLTIIGCPNGNRRLEDCRFSLCIVGTPLQTQTGVLFPKTTLETSDVQPPSYHLGSVGTNNQYHESIVRWTCRIRALIVTLSVFKTVVNNHDNALPDPNDTKNESALNRDMFF